jgi:hypothetical protein
VGFLSGLAGGAGGEARFACGIYCHIGISFCPALATTATDGIPKTVLPQGNKLFFERYSHRSFLSQNNKSTIPLYRFHAAR